MEYLTPPVSSEVPLPVPPPRQWVEEFVPDTPPQEDVETRMLEDAEELLQEVSSAVQVSGQRCVPRDSRKRKRMAWLTKHPERHTPGETVRGVRIQAYLQQRRLNQRWARKHNRTILSVRMGGLSSGDESVESVGGNESRSPDAGCCGSHHGISYRGSRSTGIWGGIPWASGSSQSVHSSPVL